MVLEGQRGLLAFTGNGQETRHHVRRQSRRDVASSGRRSTSGLSTPSVVAPIVSGGQGEAL